MSGRRGRESDLGMEGERGRTANDGQRYGQLGGTRFLVLDRRLTLIAQQAAKSVEQSSRLSRAVLGV